MLNNFSISERKVAIIGAGFVGASIAYALTIRKLAREIVLIDIHEEKTIGEALDIQHGIPDMGISSVKAGNYEDCKDCDLIIITAGRNRKYLYTQQHNLQEIVLFLCRKKPKTRRDPP